MKTIQQQPLPADEYRITKFRSFLVQAFIGLVIGGSLYDIIFKGDHWPFSSYSMYSQVEKKRTVVTLGVYGVTAKGTHPEIPLRDYALIAPFDQSRLRFAFYGLIEKDDPVRLQEALRDCLLRYERQRQAGRHRGPDIQEAKLYELEWDIDAPGGSAAPPKRRILLARAKR